VTGVQELTLVLIRFAYLAILWIFVLGAISVIRSDMFGARVETAGANGSRRERRTAQQAQKQAQKQAAKARKPARGTPGQVVVRDGPNAGQRVPVDAALDGTPLLIGRGPDAAIRLDDDYVSTRHARIGVSGDTWYVEDLGSTNGTYIGTQRLTQATAIQLGTQVRIGKTTLELGK
jgi:pSer/pThr/pTyr-binding forkhead associated (FHA) protein